MKPSPLPFALLAALAANAAAETVHGTLVDKAGTPLKGVPLTGDWYQKSEGDRARLNGYRATTDAKGAFTLEGLPAPPSAAVPVLMMADLGKGRFAVVRLTEEGGRATAKTEGTDVRFLAVDAEGRPLRGATVTLRSINVWDRPDQPIRYCARYHGASPIATTDAQGVAVVRTLPNGAFVEYVVGAPGLLARNGRLNVSPATVEVATAMVRAGILAGRVLREGKPVAGATVMALTRLGDSQEAVTGKTDADGAYRLTDVIPGMVSLRLQGGEAVGDWTSQGYAALNVRAGKELNGLNLVLERGVIVSGRVLTRQGGAPVKNAQVRLSGENGPNRSLTTDAEGRFSGRVPAGQVYVSVDGVADERFSRSVSQWVTVDEANNPVLELRVPDAAMMNPIRDLAGTVVDANGKPVAGSTVTNLSGGTTTSDADGRFRFEGLTKPGSTLVASKGGAMSSRGFEVSTEKAVTVRLDGKPARFSGRILGDDGKPIAGVEVSLGGKFGEQSVGRSAVTTDAEGRYAFDGLFPGMDEFYLWAKKAKYGGETIQPIRTTSGEDKALPDLRLHLADGVIEGRVLDPDGKPAKGATVTAQAQESAPVLTDDEGRFRLTNVPRGKRVIAAGRGNSFNSAAEARTGQKDALIKMNPPAKPLVGAVLGSRVGSNAPGFKVAEWAKNAPLDLSALKGKIVVIDFWAVWCKPCVESLPDVQRLHEAYAKQGVVVVGIHAPGTPLDKVREFIRSKGSTYANGLDTAEKTGIGATAMAFGPEGIPHMFVIGRDGKVVVDTHEVADVERAVKKLLGL